MSKKKCANDNRHVDDWLRLELKEWLVSRTPAYVIGAGATHARQRDRAVFECAMSLKSPKIWDAESANGGAYSFKPLLERSCSLPVDFGHQNCKSLTAGALLALHPARVPKFGPGGKIRYSLQTRLSGEGSSPRALRS